MGTYVDDIPMHKYKQVITQWIINAYLMHICEFKLSYVLVKPSALESKIYCTNGTHIIIYTIGIFIHTI